MNLELIFWIIASLVVWEGFYIYSIKYDKKDGEGKVRSWRDHKALAFSYTGLFLFFQLIVVMNYKGIDSVLPFYYSRLIWEVIIIILIVKFLSLNKWIYKKLK